MAKIEKYLVIPDIHVPFHCRKYISIVNKVLKAGKFAGLIQLGDFCDFYQLSSFDKDPSRKHDILSELQDYKAILTRWARTLYGGNPKATLHQLEGNHEDRLRRFIWTKAPELAKIIPSIPKMLGLSEMPLKAKWHKYEKWDSCIVGDVTLHHGVYFNQHTAANNLKIYGRKFIQGHTHRLQTATKGEMWSLTAGHGSNAKKTMHRPVPSDWTQSLSILTLVDRIGQVESYQVIKGKVTIDGKVFSS